ncbi:hypothetical protein V1520DRAFT_329618 [Lipomyces starkeyi]|uniref:Uncharacterized protein n=1 Tax=Lipomyces starkeyi NRRL Y-11557 TaxID=675824 RepID=A0A1E3PTW7_LIPST|nr:hypothetical protein LIPSTDRAFT_66803 [Lipomyces starkeyi NRRL Y-11557]
MCPRQESHARYRKRVASGGYLARVMGIDLETWFQQHIAAPLGITDLTFWPERHPELLSRLPEMTIRDPSVLGSKGKMVHYTGPPITSDVAEEFGGEGAYTSALSLKVLHSLLVDDKKLLSKETGH